MGGGSKFASSAETDGGELPPRREDSETDASRHVRTPRNGHNLCPTTTTVARAMYGVALFRRRFVFFFCFIRTVRSCVRRENDADANHADDADDDDDRRAT